LQYSPDYFVDGVGTGISKGALVILDGGSIISKIWVVTFLNPSVPVRIFIVLTEAP
jgi:hypothetical protein